MNEDQSRLTKYTQEPSMQESEEAALLQLWRFMGYGDTPGLPNYEGHTDHSVATYTEPIVPTVTWTKPTPSSSQQASDTLQVITSQAMASATSENDTCLAIDQHLQKVYQFDPLTPTNHPQYAGLSPTQSFDLPPRFVPRPAGDYQSMLQAMATGNFDIPVFGAAGAAFQNCFAAQAVPTTPSKARDSVFSSLHQQRNRTHVRGIPPMPDTPTPQPKKRKRAQTPHDTDSQEAERAPKKRIGREKKAVKTESLA